MDTTGEREEEEKEKTNLPSPVSYFLTGRKLLPFELLGLNGKNNVSTEKHGRDQGSDISNGRG